MIAVSVQNGLSGEARTHGLVIPNHALYRLSYTQICVLRESVKAVPPRAGFSRGTVEPAGIEPASEIPT